MFAKMAAAVPPILWTYTFALGLYCTSYQEVGLILLSFESDPVMYFDQMDVFELILWNFWI